MRIRYTEKLKSLYKSSDFRKLVGRCIWNSVFSIVFVIENSLKMVVVDPEEYESKAQALRNNFYKIPKDARDKVSLEILELDPYSMETYELLLPLYGDPDGSLRKLVQKIEPSNLSEFDNIRERIFYKSNEKIYYEIDKEIGKLQVGEFLGDKQSTVYKGLHRVGI